ncbi:MAG: hypothetical protein ACLSX0_01015 [Anaerostipes caccae]|jgi:hypothetical protein
MKKEYAYPAVFDRGENRDGYQVKFTDLGYQFCTFSNSISESVKLAQDVLSLRLHELQTEGCVIPSPFSQTPIELRASNTERHFFSIVAGNPDELGEELLDAMDDPPEYRYDADTGKLQSIHAQEDVLIGKQLGKLLKEKRNQMTEDEFSAWLGAKVTKEKLINWENGGFHLNEHLDMDVCKKLGLSCKIETNKDSLSTR